MTAAVIVITCVTLLGVLFRPWRTSEAAWAIAGAAALVLARVLRWQDALHAAAKGMDVYLFLVGMMLLAELGRSEGLFDWLAATCVRAAKGSASRLLLLVYVAGALVTVFMSNDATAVVVTPAVLAVSRQSGAKPTPYLLACALVANAASFALPISNPANLVVFGTSMPRLAQWLRIFSLPSLAAIVVTFVVLRLLYRSDLRDTIAQPAEMPKLGAGGRRVASAIAATACAMMVASASGRSLGATTFAAASVFGGLALAAGRRFPRQLLTGVSWSVVLLAAGLFVLVEGLEQAGALGALRSALNDGLQQSLKDTSLVASAGLAVACNLVNNLPAGLLAGAVTTGANAPAFVRSAFTIGIDLGPNFSVTGSLATILWLAAIRREGEAISGWTFFQAGVLAMPLALTAALLCLVG